MKLKSKKNKGFTLVEVMVGVAIFAVISMVLLSIMSSSLRINYINKSNYDTDSYSKAFFEAMRNDEFKPLGGSTDGSSFERTFFTAFDKVEDVKAYAASIFVPSLASGDSISDPESNLADAINDVATTYPDKNVALIVKIKWDGVEKIYNVETWAWEIGRGEATVTNRRTLVAPKINIT